jgi:hypothetical protein
MTITIHKGPHNYMVHHFPSKDLDKIKKVCYDIGISKNGIRIKF